MDPWIPINSKHSTRALAFARWNVSSNETTCWDAQFIDCCMCDVIGQPCILEWLGESCNYNEHQWTQNMVRVWDCSTLLDSARPVHSVHSVHSCKFRGPMTWPRRRTFSAGTTLQWPMTRMTPMTPMTPMHDFIVHEATRGLCGSLWVSVGLCGSLWVSVGLCSQDVPFQRLALADPCNACNGYGRSMPSRRLAGRGMIPLLFPC